MRNIVGRITSASETRELWRRFKLQGDTQARDMLITQYAYLVKITAGRVVTNLPPNVERDDLSSAGVVGLVKAVDQFDSARAVKFETYAIALIRGAILEMLREQDWMPRSMRERVKSLERAFSQLETELGRPATENEAAQALGISVDDLHTLLADASRSTLLSLDDIISSVEGNDRILIADVINGAGASPSEEIESKEAIRMLGAAIDRLPEREKYVISLYYYEGITFKEIGKVLTVSESRAYQLHAQATLRLKGHLSKDMAIFH